MNDQELSLHAGKHANYLAEQKATTPKKYHIMKRIGITTYEDIYACMRSRLGDIYYELKEHREMSQVEFFDRYINRYCPTKEAFSNYLRKMGFGSTEQSPRLSSFMRIRYILRQYERYKHDKGLDREGDALYR